jgi:hypothetical protein
MVNLDNISQLEAASDQLASSVLKSLSTVKTGVENAQGLAQSFDSQDKVYTDYKDLYDFANRLASIQSTGVQSAAQSVLQSISNTVVYERHSTVTPLAHGISIYLPVPGDRSWLASYNATQFAADAPHWAQMLAQY